MTVDRRSLLKCAAALPLTGAVPRRAFAGDEPAEKADYTVRIAAGLVELSPQHIVSTTLYNGQFPGPFIRLKEGKRVVVDIYNDTDTPELLHWHGQFVPPEVDGASEEGTPFIAPHDMRRISFVPRPAGLRFYHTHVPAGGDLNRGTYTGQAGAVYIEPANNPGAYDREVFLVLKEFEPSFSRGGDMPNDIAINGKMLGEGEPIRVRQGERVLFHVLNASAGETRSLALPGHTFRVVALDGQSGADTSRRADVVARHRRAHLRDRDDEPSRRVGPRRSRRRRPPAWHGDRGRICGR
jgi:FtsP/CotA-like multicopper oxidase with cupredoxin domain